jgi:predicted outer membrane lipoprotein
VLQCGIGTDRFISHEEEVRDQAIAFGVLETMAAERMVGVHRKRLISMVCLVAS